MIPIRMDDRFIPHVCFFLHRDNASARTGRIQDRLAKWMLRSGLLFQLILIACIATAQAQPPIQLDWVTIPVEPSLNRFRSAQDVVCSNAGDYYITALTGHPFDQGQNLMLYHCDASGQLLDQELLRIGEDAIYLNDILQLPNSQMVVSGSMTTYLGYPGGCFIECLTADMDQVWEYTRSAMIDYGFWLGEVVLGTAPGTQQRLIYQLFLDSHYGNDDFSRFELMHTSGFPINRIQIPFQLHSNKCEQMLPLENGDLIVSEDEHITRYSLINHEIIWSYELEDNVKILRRIPTGGCLALLEDYQDDCTIMRFTEAGEMEWQTVLPDLRVKDLELLDDETIIYTGYPFSGDEHIHLGLMSPDGDIHWGGNYRPGYWPTALDVTANGEGVITGSYYTGNQLDTNFFLAHFRLTGADRVGDQAGISITSPASMHLAASPNPFNAATTVAVSLTDASTVTAVVYDLLGRPVRTLAQNQPLSAGEHRFAVDGAGLASGTYILTLDAGVAGASSRRITLVK